MIITKQNINDINNFITTNFEYYSKLTDKDIKIIKKFIKEFYLTNKIKLNIDDIINFRNIYIYILRNTKGIIANKFGNNIINDYTNNISILDIAKKYNLPPILILYQIFIEQKYETDTINNLLNNIQKLPVDIQSQIDEIILYDPNRWLDFNESCNKCNLKEINKIIDKITNVSYKINDYNQNVLIIFDEIVKYKDIKFKWMDVKKYLFFQNNLIINYIKKDINKNIKIGPGVLLFCKIYSSKENINSIIKISPKLIKFYDYSFIY